MGNTGLCHTCRVASPLRHNSQNYEGVAHRALLPESGSATDKGIMIGEIGCVQLLVLVHLCSVFVVLFFSEMHEIKVPHDPQESKSQTYYRRPVTGLGRPKRLHRQAQSAFVNCIRYLDVRCFLSFDDVTEI